MESGDTAEPAPLPHVDSEEFGRINVRRFELIQKKNRGGLSDGERAELDRLEEVVDTVVNRAYPRTPFDWDRLRKIEERLASRDGT